MSFIEQSIDRPAPEWVSFRVRPTKEGIACTSETISQEAKNWVHQIMKIETIFEHFDAILKTFHGSLTVKGNYEQISVEKLQQAIAWQFRVLWCINHPKSDFATFRRCQSEFQSSCVQACVRISYNI